MNSKRILISSLVATLALGGVAVAQEAKDPKPANLKTVQNSTVTPGAQPVKITPTPGEVANVPAQPTSLPASEDAADSPFTWDAMKFDWGNIPDTSEVTHEFKFTAKDKAVKIREARGSCGCTVPTLTKKDFQPGEAGTMMVKFNPSHRKGPQQKTVTVFYEDPTMKPTLLNLTSNVQPLVFVDPIKMYVNDVEKGKGKTVQIKVSGRSADFKVTGVDFSNEYLTVKVNDPAMTDIEGEQLLTSIIDVTVSPNAPIGNVECLMKIQTNEPKQATVDYNFLATVVGDLFASPQAISVREFNPGYPFTTQVVIDSRAGKPFNVVAVSAESPTTDIVADIETIAGSNGKNLQIVKISGRLPDQAGPVQGTVLIKTDAEDGELRIPFFANVRRVVTNAAAVPAK